MVFVPMEGRLISNANSSENERRKKREVYEVRLARSGTVGEEYGRSTSAALPHIARNRERNSHRQHAAQYKSWLGFLAAPHPPEGEGTGTRYRYTVQTLGTCIGTLDLYSVCSRPSRSHSRSRSLRGCPFPE